MPKHYESTWQGGFHDTLPKKVRTMAITKKHIQMGSAKLYHNDLFTHHWLASFLSGHGPQRGVVVPVNTYPYINVYQNWLDAISDK